MRGRAAPWLTAWLLVFLATSLIAIVFATQWYSTSRVYGRHLYWPELLAIGLREWWIWAALAPAAFALSAAAPLDRGRRIYAIALHMAAALLFAAAHLALLSAIGHVLPIGERDPHTFGQTFEHLMRIRIAPGVVAYWALVGLAQAVLYRNRLAAREQAEVRLKAELGEAQLEALKFQLNPHFLFNALNTISGLVHREPALADRAIADLGDILRNALRRQGQTVTLAEEVEIASRYLAIEQLRLGDRLRVEIEMEDEAKAIEVPVFALQLLAENAVRHGIEPSAEDGTVTLGGRLVEGGIELIVANTGGEAGASEGHKVGLANLEARLHHLFGGRARLEMESGADGRQVRLFLPAVPSRRN
jgi:hypothetical protein